MARVTPAFSSFGSGELTPRLDGRIDLQEIYFKGCKTLENMFVYVHGGASKRPGTAYIAEAAVPSGAARLVPFVFSETQAYVIEFGHKIIRFFTDGGLILEDDNETVYSLISPYFADDLAELKYAQIGDVIYLTHPLYPLYKLQRYGHNIWTISLVELYNGPYLDQNEVPDFTLTPSNTTGQITITVDNNIDNPEFTDDLSDWTLKQGSGDIYRDAADNAIVIIGNGTDLSLAEQYHSFDTNYVYNMSFEVSGGTTATLMFSQNPCSGPGEYTSKYYPSGTHSIDFAPSADNMYVGFGNDDTDPIAIHNIELKPKLFSEYHEYALWSFAGSEEVERDCGAENQFTEAIIVDTSETFVFSITGTWVATVTLQKSYDEGTTWVDFATATENASSQISETQDGIYWRAGIKTGDYTSGTAEVKISLLDQSGYTEIESYTDEYNVTARVRKELPQTGSTYKWSEGAFSDYRGFPNAIAFYEQRLVLAGTTFRPQTIWASQVDDYENFEIGVNDNDAYIYSLASLDVNNITWMIDKQYLLIGTLAGEWRFGFSDDPTTPTSVAAYRQTTNGCEDVDPITVGHQVMYLQKGGTKLRTLNWDYRIESYISPDISIKAEHLMLPGVSDIAYSNNPDPIIWMVTASGGLVGCTIDPQQEIAAFHQHSTEGDFESVCVIPGSDRDEVWTCVKRNVNGSDTRYIEQFQTTQWVDNKDAYYVDSALEGNYSPQTTSVSGLGHLEGETVSILTDGAVHPDRVVSGGSFSLQVSASKVIAGLPYTGKLETMQIEAGTQAGTAQGKRQKLYSITARLYNSLGVKLGYTDEDNTEVVDIVPFRSSADLMGQPPALFTGDKTYTFNRGYHQGQRILILNDQPLPFTVLALMPVVRTSDK